MKILAQYEINPRRYYEPYQKRDRLSPESEVIIAFITLTIMFTIAWWLFLSWRLPSKAGYRGAVRWIWFWTLAFPLTAGWSLIMFVLLPWPVQKQLKQIAQAPAPRPIKSDIDEELDRLKQGKKE